MFATSADGGPVFENLDRSHRSMLVAPALRKGCCGRAKVGVLVGAVIGLLTHPLIAEAPISPPYLALTLAILAGLVAWMIVLILVGVLLRFGALRIALPALVNCLITSVAVVVVFSSMKFHLPPIIAAILGMILGQLIGVLVGLVLCWICKVGLSPETERSLTDG